jgi:hypothetical protein
MSEAKENILLVVSIVGALVCILLVSAYISPPPKQTFVKVIQTEVGPLSDYLIPEPTTAHIMRPLGINKSYQYPSLFRSKAFTGPILTINNDGLVHIGLSYGEILMLDLAETENSLNVGLMYFRSPTYYTEARLFF